MLEGVRVLLGTAMVRRLILYWTIVMATVAIVMAAAIVWFEEDLGVADAWYGMSVAAYGDRRRRSAWRGPAGAASGCPLADDPRDLGADLRRDRARSGSSPSNRGCSRSAG